MELIFYSIIFDSTIGIEKTKLGDDESSGMVFLCRDLDSREQFVLKKPKLESQYNAISTHSKISESHNLVGFKGLYNDEGVICIAMEYMPKVSLVLVTSASRSTSIHVGLPC